MPPMLIGKTQPQQISEIGFKNLPTHEALAPFAKIIAMRTILMYELYITLKRGILLCMNLT